jgi:hypothetical protein
VPSHLSNPWNNAVAYLSMSYGKQQLSTGSSFFWEFGGRTFLLTNWHNLAGRNPLTGCPMSTTGGLPDRVTFMAYRQMSLADPNGFYALEYVPIEVQICDNDWTNPRWFEHPAFGKRVDVAAIDVTDAIKGFEMRHANILEGNAMLGVATSQDVFVVGFPFGQMPKAPAPIWKRGTIALDPTFDLEGLPKMLIDTATREGMSGSLVVARHIIAGRDYPKKDGTKSEMVPYAQLDLVIGIYSGRHYADIEKAQLGIVWKRSTIEETVAGRQIPRV